MRELYTHPIQGVNIRRRVSESGGHPLDVGLVMATPTGFEPAISALTGQYVKATTPRGRAGMNSSAGRWRRSTCFSDRRVRLCYTSLL